MKLTGKCYCGALHYEAEGDPLLKAQCHCRECQFTSGGGPNYFMLLSKNGFRYTVGTPRQFTRTDLENAVTREFCGDCGTPILSRLPGRDQVAFKVGSLDDLSLYGQPKIAIYTCDKQPFHTVADGIPEFDKLPPR